MRAARIPLLLLALAACRADGGPPPNVLLVVLDTTRADAVSFGDPSAPAALGRLVDDGVVFTNARSTSAWTVPAHGSLFTGLYPSRHGAHHESPRLAPERTTLAELLEPTHETAAFSENPHIGPGKGFDQGFGLFEDSWRLRRGRGPRRPTVQHVDRWLRGRQRERPFFLFVNLMDPHLPYQPPREWARRFVPPDVDPAQLRRMRATAGAESRRYIAGDLALSPDDLRLLRALYRGEVAFAEARLSRLLETLEEEGLLERTLVAVVGDHGENIGEHGLMQHQLSLHETLLRVPLLMRLPGRLDGGERRADPVQLVDVFATILDAAGVPPERWPAIEGQSLLSGRLPPQRPLIAEYMRPLGQRRLFARTLPDFDFEPFDRRLASIQVGGLKLIRSDRGERWLYDLGRDPGEAQDLAATRPGDVARLSAELDRWLASRPAAAAGAPAELDEETLRALRELGYGS